MGRAILWCTSAGAVALALKSVLGEPPPLGVAVVALVVYLGILVVLTLMPQLEAFGDCLCRVPEARGLVALTFDDGPDPVTTPRVLGALAAEGHKATFFLIGNKVDAHPEVVRQIHEQGHQLGLHGYRHDRLYSFKTPASVKDDVERCQDAVERAAGVRPLLFRPPIGQASPRTFAGARRAKVEVVGWSLRPRDGAPGAASDLVAERVTSRIDDGVIVLLHDATERGTEHDVREPVALAALPQIFDALRKRKLRSVTIEQLVEAARA